MKRLIVAALAVFSLIIAIPASLMAQEVAALTGVVSDKTGCRHSRCSCTAVGHPH